MQRRYTVGAALLLIAVAGCSSAPPSAPELPDGALPAGTAQVTVNGSGTASTHDVQCQKIEGYTFISIGRADARIKVLVDDDAPKGVAFNEVEGFTGSYWEDLQGSAKLGMVDQTYALTGTAAGFNAGRPHTRTTDSFNVRVAC